MKLNQFLFDDLEEDLLNVIRHKRVAVVGAGPSLSNLSHIEEEVIVAADGASRFLEAHVRVPDIVVTDLDGIVKPNRSPIYVVHAHGDNMDKLERLLELKKVVGTCQVANTGRAKLYGGFTDGDRAVLLSLVGGASSVRLYAMDLDSNLIGMYSKPYFQADVPINLRKKIKLGIAKEVIYLINNKVSLADSLT
ncbi:6-hydroxymethylpterin diphosphokinase MptE-like protein [Sulfuracidifex tepidarius]|uniref:6-hydroxymethyl-7,8-dihydropterin pyrophosphokinase n=1 Tax=Sulfuracidifex tepidarius TaxID=1294262 RepID=A0A510DZ74_9CREN|nr:6-hydroxymethylpterin diphosphokinase MptE-like protein [Sulfuracidifex tepidarius]BBG25250.1 6-hydroxymethyl-7,8-dihydropterin pyrophosphokinase [Sulfuracidifex tepidarius]BBG28044.1 6-hydroxymethyl-7,8-dihydropterin pyrophosphokinase [Sulfuracidifex tepidarius]